MDKKSLLSAILAFLLLPQLVSADLIIPLSRLTIPLIPFIIFVEAFAFWLLADKVIKVPIGFWKLVLVTFVANIVTSFLGTFVRLYKNTDVNLILVGVAFVFSAFIEWGIYIPFFRKVNMRILDLLKISFLANLATYIPLSFLIAYAW
ncbi:hypothetical protein JW968_03975 [Candidatus Woesearchaeota archaeon]|nr:hypothetical protein [Candidatus Woesearchaeota archaeon]